MAPRGARVTRRGPLSRPTSAAIAALFLVNAASITLVAPRAALAVVPGEPFVTRVGTELRIGSAPWYLYGASSYGTSNPSGAQSVAAEIALALDARLNTIRIVNMFDERGLADVAPYDEAAWVRVDQLLAASHEAGLHVLLDLSAFRNHLHNRELYVQGLAAIGAGSDPPECASSTGDEHVRCVGARFCVGSPGSCTNPYSLDRAAAWDTFLGTIALRTNTVTGQAYRDDPTIALVAFAGEPNPPNSGEPLKPGTQELTDFYGRVFGQWKSRDSHHLVTSGGLLHIDWEEVYGNPNGSGIDHAAIFALPNQDVLSIHDYFPSFPPNIAADAKLAKVATAAASVGKPWITEEFGFTQAPTDDSTSPATVWTEADRGRWFGEVLAAQRQPPTGAAAAGVAFWNLGPEASSGSHDVNATTPVTWAAVRHASPATWQLVSMGPNGDPASTTVRADVVKVSADGSHVLFQTRESLVPEDSNTQIDLYDRADGVTKLVSVGSAGSLSLYDVNTTYLSTDGSVVVFETSESLLPEDTDAQLDVYRRAGGITTLVSTGPNDDGNSYGQLGGVSADGSVVVFGSGGQLTDEDADTNPDVYRWASGVVALASKPESGAVDLVSRASYSGMSVDGAHVFMLTEERLAPGDTDSTFDVFDRTGGHTLLISTGPSDVGEAYGAFVGATPDGSHAYFISDSPLTPNDGDAFGTDIYERAGGVTRLVSTNVAGAATADNVRFDGVSADASHVFFTTSSRLSAADTDTWDDQYDFTAGDAVLVSTGDVEGVDSWSTFLRASTDGSRVLFLTRNSLVAADADGSGDIYERSSGRTRLVSGELGPQQGIDAQFVGASSDGRRVIFVTSEPIDPADTNGSDDVYAWEAGVVTWLRARPAASPTVFAALSADGRRLAIASMDRLDPVDLDQLRTDVYEIRLDAPAGEGFIAADGTHLELDGAPFTFTGINIYNANSDDWCASNMDNGIFEAALDEIGLGPRGDGVIRAWFFQPLATRQFTGARDWTRFDRTLAAAKAAGYHVIPTLGNQWGECGHKGPTAGYKFQGWYESGYRYLQPEDSVYATYRSYRSWVAEVVGRYRDDPTILAWQLLNEAETSPSWPSCPAGDATMNAIKGWASDVSSLIKTIDPNHLVSLGTIGSGQCGASGPQYKTLHAIPTIDLCEFHDYNEWVAMPGDSSNGLAKRLTECGQLGKPLFVGEVGIRPSVGGSLESRVAALRAKVIAQRTAGVVGHLAWNWVSGPSILNDYGIGAGDPVLTLLASGPDFDQPPTAFEADYVAPTVTLNAPSRSLYTLNEALTASYSCAEVTTDGVAPVLNTGLASCVGTLPSGATVDTSTTGRFTFTVTTTDNNGNVRTVWRTYDVTRGDVETTVQGSNAGPVLVTTDPGAVGATPAVPIQTSVAFDLPAGQSANVSIELAAPDVPPPSGYSILGQQVNIDLGAIVRPASNPIVITFLVDSSTGADPATIAISRTNADLTTDVAAPCTAVPTAVPDPCFVAAWVAGPGSDVRVTVYTTHASSWLALQTADSTPPQIAPTVSGTLGTNGWYRGDVSISWAVSDPQSAVISMTGCSPSSVVTDTAGTTRTCSARSGGGEASASVTVKRDATAPTLTCQPASFLVGAVGATVTALVSDGLSGPLATTVSAPANTGTAGRRTVSLTAADLAGNTSTASCAYTVGFAVTDLRPVAGAVFKRGTTIPVRLQLRDASGHAISDADGRALARACALQVLFGADAARCASYDAGANLFTVDVKTAKNLAVGTYVIGIRVTVGGATVTTATTSVEIRT
jgi:hypothetical protein